MAGPVVPFRQLVLKVHSRCDLACKHCYVYEHADQSWSSRPTVISDETITWTANRLAEHAKTHALPSVHVILHGGEPLLAGTARLRRVCEELRAALAGISDLDLRIHTNGVQLNRRHLDLFDEFDVKVGISLDGDKAANDRHRLYANGRSSHHKVLAAVGLLRQQPYRHLFAGLLCTIDVANDPIAVYDALAELAPPRIDFLLPHATWDEPPARPEGAATAYADWLLRIYDRWDDRGRPMPIRLFDSVISTLGGGPSLTESMGLGPTDLVVIETDGTLEQADSLKTAYDGAPVTGFDVFADSLDAAARHPGVVARQQGLSGLSEECRACPVVRSCGGGLYAHRYRSGSGPAEQGFDHPSVYCADLKSLVLGIGSRVGDPAPGTYGAPGGESFPGIDELADPAGDGAAVARLAAEQRQLTRRWLSLVDGTVGADADGLWEQSRHVLGELAAVPGGLDPLLAHPYTRSWAVESYDTLSARGRLGVGAAERLAALTASAAIHAGLPLTLSVPVGADGALDLPTLGRVQLRAAGERLACLTGYGTGFVIRRGCEELVVEPGLPPGQRWFPVRHMKASTGGHTVDLAVDDVDPLRDRFPEPALDSLTPTQFASAQAMFADAWDLLGAGVPARLPALTAALTTLTPLARPVAGLADGRRGMGAVGVAFTDAEGVARQLLTGARYAVLDALLEQCELYDEADPRSFPVPWGDGQRLPAGELLARAFARTATSVLAARPGEHAAATAGAWRALLASGTLTPDGTRVAERALAAVGEHR
ncbi:uncharacterized protein SAMN05216251_101247 [Actinacidiphila alni]|uniref:Radical SAM core domain-containing protein n=1 Tax=Actinacidiphila alni TaxID=380248 RepID=A0A1I1X8K1_9ACTN|nr:uncharacterized protein SAMN05216251_101247 [Actinacidiphila alni]